MAKILDTEGLNRLGADVREMIAKVSVPTITIAASQVVGQDPLEIQLTNEQYNALASSQIAIVDATALGFSALSTAVREGSSTDVLWFYARVLRADSYEANVEEYSYEIDRSTKILTQYSGKFYAIPTVTITSDNIDQTTGNITLDSEQRDVLNNNFIVQFDASIVSYPIIQGYKIWWDSDNVQFVAGASMTGSTWSYTRISVDENNLFAVDAYELNSSFDPTNTDNSPITSSVVTQALNAYNATATGVTSGSTLPDTIIRSFVSDMLPIQINGALCHFVNVDTSTRVARYFTATMNGALVHLNIIEINTSTWVVTFNQVDVGASPNVDQDLTANTCFTLDATAFASLVSTHTATVASPVFTGLSNAYEFVTIKASINGTNYNIKLSRNDTSKYSGLFFIEDSSHLYELTLYYNGTSVYLRCATVY